jgi:hypothetical protein
MVLQLMWFIKWVVIPWIISSSASHPERSHMAICVPIYRTTIIWYRGQLEGLPERMQTSKHGWQLMLPGRATTVHTRPQGHKLWQNRLNYSGSSALVIAMQPIITQRTSNGITHWSVGSSPDITTVQQDRGRFISREGEFTTTQ